ncbi:MAG: DDE-type integrase/transposase/recombinase [Lentisphaerae bacterium]|nr:DDE-type integrase/transposase/recombinase [Lentisphaerota bacterium]
MSVLMAVRDDGSVRGWRTREDPFAAHWDEVVELLETAPELQAVRLFDYLREKYPGHYTDGQVRTLQRRLRAWRAGHGPERELFFEQVHCPGEAVQLDWLDCNGLGITIAGDRFEHKLCHCACVYSKWEWARLCFSEDFLSLRNTFQDALFRLGGVPKLLQVDNSSAATCQLVRGEQRRGFNARFKALLKHFDCAGRKVTIGCAHENGTVEKLHDHFRVRLDQALKLRGHRDFGSVGAYEQFVLQQLTKANGNRTKKMEEERRHLKPLPCSRYPDFDVESHRIGVGGTVRIKKKVYSVPSRLKGFRVSCRIYGSRIDLYVGSDRMHSMPRAHGEASGILWQDLVGWLVRKPGAFARYRYRDAMFPSAVHRQLCTALHERLDAYVADREYLLILNASAGLSQPVVEKAIGGLLSDEAPLSLEGFREASGLERPTVDLPPFVPDLSVYNVFAQERSNDEQSGDVSEELSAADDGSDR